MRVLEVEVLL
jgi:hypothetical protein